MIQQPLTDVSLRNFVEQRTKDSFYYSQSWLDLITKLYGYTVIPLTTRNATGQFSGFLPLCLMQSPLTGRRLVSLPFSDYCPVVAGDEDSANELIDQAIQLARQQRVRYLEIRSGTNEVLAKRADMVKGDLYVRWLMPLAADPDTLWSGLRKPVQHQVKKSRKLGV